MSNTVHAFDFLAAPDSVPRAPVCVLFGNEPFLKRLTKLELRNQLVGVDSDTPVASFDGETAQWRDVIDELSTASLFGGGGPRLAIVDDADKFVTQFRDKLEDYLAKPRSTGVLLLDVETWAANTRLYKLVDKTGLQIECRAPESARGKNKTLDEGKLCKWLTQWAKRQHEIMLSADAAKAMVDLVGAEIGMLDQELAKLALFVERGGKITPEMVHDVVGGWRTKTTWDLIDAATDGNVRESLQQLDKLLQSGQEPIALFGSIAWSLRRFAAASRIYRSAEREGRRIPVTAALEQAGFYKWPAGNLEKAERQLVQLGRVRASRLYRWLLEADLALKGSHSSPTKARFVLEQLFARMSKEAVPAKK